MSLSVDSTTSSAQATEQTSSSSSTNEQQKLNLVNKDDFLRLLVAQIRYQDPLNPADGVQFLSQLAQFSQLEQLINIRTDLDAIVSGQTTDATQAADASQTSSSATA